MTAGSLGRPRALQSERGKQWIWDGQANSMRHAQAKGGLGKGGDPKAVFGEVSRREAHIQCIPRIKLG